MIYIVKNNKPFGVLTQADNNITFEYDNSIQKKNYLPGLKEKINNSKVLFPLFNNMLPEHEQKNLLLKKHNITNDIDILPYLDNIHGTFEFYTEDKYKTFTPKDYEEFIYNEKIDEILSNNYKFPNILSDYTLNIDTNILYPTELVNSKVIGLSGFQYKFSVIIDETTKTITHDSSKSSNYFMKPFSKYQSIYNFKDKDKDKSYIPYLLINEHLFMTLARDFGFKVPYNGIIKNEMDYHYIIKRYDRYSDTKIDHTEILTLMDKVSTEKYNINMQELFKTAQKYIDEVEQLLLFKFIIFSVVIAHGDLHAKNLSLINKSNKSSEELKQLSPFYDISTTKIYKDTKANDIGLKIINKKSNIDRTLLLKFANIIDIEKSCAETLIDEVCIKFIDSFMNYINKLPNEIKGLPFNTGQYSKSTFENVFKKYYKQRVSYINEKLIDKKRVTQKTEDDFWNS
ncbi:type II toxin-antitoxin system HipA family toxin [Aliarcobacter butzleri]|uniref:type II toxin-antitoxin system HipA family toxin n=1 Tax=Aliarcobacter butzleri TaxID=28197 RepID=UPI0021B534E3|nr:type II toxin-antitoxin system HipA family toxin [Aliarcobacter butzleri]MCT7575353.1 type II toxin-antitoxin system HipA family toxin [Aliarcobacter butzleri]